MGDRSMQQEQSKAEQSNGCRRKEVEGHSIQQEQEQSRATGPYWARRKGVGVGEGSPC